MARTGRPRTGTVRALRDGRWQMIVTFKGRPVPLNPPLPLGTSKDEARRQAAYWAAEALHREQAGLGLDGKPEPATNRQGQPERPASGAAGAALEGIDAAMASWFDTWITDRRRRGITTVPENVGHWRHHIAPVLGRMHIREWTPAGLRELVRALDTKVQDGALAWKTAINVWATASRMCKDAARSKLDTLRCREDNPAGAVEAPDRGAAVDRQFLWPAEVAAVLACREVPLEWRLLIALGVYTYCRTGELRVLRWRDVDIEHAVIHVHRALDRRDGGEKATKGKRGRLVPIEPALLPLLVAMKAETADPDAVVLIDMPAEQHIARGVRRALLRAGVVRPELHHTTSTSRAHRGHDLRATGITWMAVRGDEPLRIMQRAGHRDVATTMGYVRTAEVLRASFGDVFATVPSELVSADFHARLSCTAATEKRNPKGINDGRRWGRDSNAHRAIEVVESATVAEGQPCASLPSKSAIDGPSMKVVQESPAQIDVGGASPYMSPEQLRAKLLRAIDAEAWDAVKVIREEIARLDRAGVVDLDAERRKRGS